MDDFPLDQAKRLTIVVSAYKANVIHPCIGSIILQCGAQMKERRAGARAMASAFYFY